MHEDNCNCILQEKDIPSLVQLCLRTEQDSGLAENSLKELKRYFNEFTYHYKSQNVHSVKELTPEFLRHYADQRCDGTGPNLKKAVVWSLRKFGKHIALLQVVKENPARHLRHPRFHPRSELPEYLSEAQLRILMENAANCLSKMDFAILSLLTTAGLRPYEITAIRQRGRAPYDRSSLLIAVGKIVP